MPSTAELESVLFRHLTNRAKPALKHPTHSSFDLSEWKAVAASVNKDQLTDRDHTLAQAAALIGLHNTILRQDYTSNLFAGFTPEQVLILAVARANRAFLIIREKALEEVENTTNLATMEGRHVDLGVTSQVRIQTSEEVAPTPVDDTNTSVIDALPHWFALAIAPPSGLRASDENLIYVAEHAGAILSLEHSFRSVWQQALWEPWKIERNSEAGYLMTSTDPELKIGWRIWELREQMLSFQGAIINKQFDRMNPNRFLREALPLTVTAINLASASPLLTIAPPSQEQASHHRMTLNAFDDIYTRRFAEQEVGGPSITPMLLSRVMLVLQDIVSLALPSDTDPEEPDWQSMRRLSCSLPRECLIRAISESLGVETVIATACIAFLTSDPASDLQEIFRIGVWHRPLISMPDGKHLLVIAGAIMWGSPIRQTERWLQRKNGEDLEAVMDLWAGNDQAVGHECPQAVPL